MRLIARHVFTVMLPLMLAATASHARDIGSPDPETFKRLYPGKAYLPYAQR